MKTHIQNLSLLILIFASVHACKVDPAIPKTREGAPVFGISFNVPSGWPQPVYNYQTNTLSDEGFRLGRKLFYDTRLSRDNTISCGSCHQDFAAFAHSAHSLSHGIDGLFGTRNAPALFNLNWHPNFMWDGGVNHIEVQPLAPIINPVEMDETMENVIVKLKKDLAYQQMFTEVFGDNTINSQRIFRAIAQFQGMLVSANSKYDKYVRGEPGGVLSDAEQRGLTLFTEKKCASCHVPPLFTDFSFRNNGLRYNTALNDSGRAHVTGLASDRNKFKVPSLRNITVTSPYMHDGRFKKLSEVMNHYTSGIIQSKTLAPELKEKIKLTENEKVDIISFLLTLSDKEFVFNSNHSYPKEIISSTAKD